MLGVGAEWLRWEPHVHTPGTMRNDQFAGDWGGWLKAVEDADPPIRALGVTDYNWFDGYLRVREEKVAGRLPVCDLIFPNIELRMENKAEEAPVNLHLLVRPDDPSHVKELEGFLDALTFEWDGMPYSGRPDSLVRLGRKINPTLVDDRAARALGSEQFKLSLDRLRSALRSNAWARANILVAVAARSGDGLSGLRGGFLAQRAELARWAHVIFDSNPKSRDYWLGRGVDTAEQVASQWAA